jgi:hypothetical protein
VKVKSGGLLLGAIALYVGAWIPPMHPVTPLEAACHVGAIVLFALWCAFDNNNDEGEDGDGKER